MKRFLTCILVGSVLSIPIANGQEDSTGGAGPGDPITLDILPLYRPLPEYTYAYDLHQRLNKVPASIGIVSEQSLKRFGNASIVQAINTVAGVRMEERSPGSYRLTVRGSSLRAPFGVRNVKVYYNGIPFTDPGGGTYLNQLGYYNISRMEIIKGPGSSLYGAGTGGVVLIESIPRELKSGFELDATTGSYGLINMAGEWRSAEDNGLKSIVRYQHLTTDGFRDHSALRRDVLSWDASGKLSTATTINTHMFYTDLFYETPGALTLSEYEADPRKARPNVSAILGSKTMNAAVRQKAFVLGTTLQHYINTHWLYNATLYGAYTALDNPTLRNYGRNSEPHLGGRASVKYSNTYKKGRLDWITGAEVQQGLNSIQVYSSVLGKPDTLQTDDKLHIRLATGFTQGSFEWDNWLFTAGASISNSRMIYGRLTNRPYSETTKDFNNEISPRVAVRYSFHPRASVYASVSRGFSPPTSGELSPSGSLFNGSLKAEQGWNYEAGLKGNLLIGDLTYEVTAYYFSLSNTIVQRRDSAGGDYFINSGSTRQAGIEASLRYKIIVCRNSTIKEISLFTAYTYQHFRYKDFVQVEADYSGNALPGVAPNTLAAGIDWETIFGLYGRLSYYYSDITPLNDAGSASVPLYQLFSARLGYVVPLKGRFGVELFTGGDNLGDVTYNAGPDINGFGGRYYNAAPGRSFYAGIALRLDRDRQ